MKDYSDPNASLGPLMGMMGAFGLIYLAIFVFMIFCWWKIFSKAGYSGALALLWIVPIANIILFIWFAFAKWPALNRSA